MVAVETLRSNTPLLSRIEKEVSKVCDNLTTETRWYFLTTLMWYTFDGSLAGTQRGPYPPVYITVGGTNVEKFSPEYRAISTAIQEQQLYLEQLSGADEILQDVLDRYNRLEEFSEVIAFGNRTHRILKEQAIKLG
jgi:hypothetical protein